MFAGIDYFTQLQTAVAAMMRAYSPEFMRFGLNVFLASAIIKMIVTGWEMAFRPGSAEDNNYLFGRTVLQMAVGFTIITFYETPDPVFGYSFSGIIVDQMAAFAHILDAAVVMKVVTTLDALMSKFVEPGLTEFLANVIYYGVFFFVTLAKVISLVIIAFSLFAQAVLVLVGPIFCSLFLVPHFNRYFWGFVDALIQWSFLQVTAYAYMLVGIYLLAALVTGTPEHLTSDLYLTYGAQIFVYVLAYVLGFALIPMLNASIFGGAASASVTHMIRVRRLAV